MERIDIILDQYIEECQCLDAIHNRITDNNYPMLGYIETEWKSIALGLVKVGDIYLADENDPTIYVSDKSYFTFQP